jgi:hypothetical protein
MEINVIPDWVLAKCRVPEHLRVHAGFWLSAVMIVLVVPLLRYVPHVCLVKALLGIPCPGCGITTALRAMANPAGIAVAGVFLFQLLARPIALLSLRSVRVVSSVSAGLSNVALAALFVTWGLRIFRIIS